MWTKATLHSLLILLITTYTRQFEKGTVSKYLNEYLNHVKALQQARGNRVEEFHDPWLFSPDRDFKPELLKQGISIPPIAYTPDFRIPERPWIQLNRMIFKENNRPLRLTPWNMFGEIWRKDPKWGPIDEPETMMCYVAIMYKREVLLSSGAALTTRHTLTTATSVATVIRKYGSRHSLTDVLGVLHHTRLNTNANQSIYTDVARIHYHPLWNGISGTNRSHPLPSIFDLAVLTATKDYVTGVEICKRPGSHPTGGFGYANPPKPEDRLFLAGHMFIVDVNRRPDLHSLYVVKTMLSGYRNCATGDRWGHFYCICSPSFARYGFDSGGALHFNKNLREYYISGLIGINSFSMKLRSKNICHYFTVLDRHSVLDFLYDAYMGHQKYVWLHGDYEDSKGQGSPALKSKMLRKGHASTSVNYFPKNQ